MAQKLIVEGNDAIALANLCIKGRLNPPLGYESYPKFKKEFVVNSGGFDRALKNLKEILDQSDVTNLGIIVDANDVGYVGRWQAIRSILAAKYGETSLGSADAQIGPKVVVEADKPTVGVWIMPDNANVGYLEHFLAKLIPEKDPLWAYAQRTIKNLCTQTFNELGNSKIGKAQLHTWLSWKEDPGKPFGQAIEANYLPLNPTVVQPFFDWFSATFELVY